MAGKKGANSMHETIIIGAGIAGLTAAIYAARKRMDFLIISEDFGGQFNVSGEVVNYPGIIETTGADFEKIMEKQMKFNKVDVRQEKVAKIEKISKGNFRIVTNKGKHETKTIIIATGARPRKLDVPGEKEFANKGLTYCAICDGPLFTGKKVAIIGGGDAGLEAADFMLNIAKDIKMLESMEKSKAHEYLQQRIFSQKKVEFINKAAVKEIYGRKFVEGLKYERDGKVNDLKVDGIIIEIGRAPNTELFRGLVELDEHNHVAIDQQTRTSVQGIFAAGDCASGHEYQYVIAAGQGCMALLKAARYLAKKKE